MPAYLAAAAILAAAALTACVQVPDAPAAPTETVVQARNGTRVQLAVGQVLAIELPSNASTGYSWEIVESGAPVMERAPLPPALVTEKPRDPPMAGAGGTSRWRFKAVQAGTTDLRLVYRRVWEKNVPPVQTAEYKVEVE